MSSPLTVNILSSDEDDDVTGNEPGFNVITTHTPFQSKKKQKIDFTTVFEIDDDDDYVPNLCKKNKSVSLITEDIPMSDFSKANVFDAQDFLGYPGTSKPCLVPETPMSESSKSAVPVVKHPEGIGELIYLASDNESEEEGRVTALREINNSYVANEFQRTSRSFDSDSSFGNYKVSQTTEESLSGTPGKFMAHRHLESDTENLPRVIRLSEETDKHKDDSKKCQDIDELRRKKRTSKEERDLLKEKKNQQKEQKKLQKAAEKAEAAELKKLQKEKQRWAKGKLANKSIVAEIDCKVVEMGSVGGHLLTRFSEKGVKYHIKSNPIERSIVWTMTIPEHIAQISNETEVRYILLVYNAEEFCNFIVNGSLMNHVLQVRRHYPYHTICFLTNKLMAYINKREQEQYKNPNFVNWTCPPVEEVVLSKLTTHFARVHTRQCIDEAELAEHVVGLTCSIASCQFRKKLSRLSVNANESPKDPVDRDLIKKNTWLKALVAIPKVQPRFAISIGKKYPTMKSLLSVYMDPNKTVHEKEMLLKDIIMEGLLGNDRRLGEVCSKRVYRVLMAQCGNIIAADVEKGVNHQPS